MSSQSLIHSALNGSTSATTGMNTTIASPFLELPYELRHKIYEFICYPKPTITVRCSIVPKESGRYRDAPHFPEPLPIVVPTLAMTLRSENYHVSIAKVNKDLYREALPVLQSNVHLIINSCSPRFFIRDRTSLKLALETIIPPAVLRHISEVTYLLPTGPSANTDELPEEPFPFPLCPALKTFRVQRTIDLAYDTFYHSGIANASEETNNVENGQSRPARPEYKCLDDSKKLEYWKLTSLLHPWSILRSISWAPNLGWIPKLLRPGMDSAQKRSLLPGSHKTAAQDDSGPSASSKEETIDPSGLGVPRGCRITVLTKYHLHMADSNGQNYLEMLHVDLDVKTEQTTVGTLSRRRTVPSMLSAESYSSALYRNESVPH